MFTNEFQHKTLKTGSANVNMLIENIILKTECYRIFQEYV